MKLLERFYDPTSGEICLDGKEIKSLNLKSLREKIGFVGQEPVLFSTTVKENIKFGLSSAQRDLEPAAIDKLIEEACKSANAWDFISKLPSGLDTQVGESAGKISGGQKQVSLPFFYLK